VHAVGRAEPTLLDEHRKPGADQFAIAAAFREFRLKSLPIDCFERLVE